MSSSRFEGLKESDRRGVLSQPRRTGAPQARNHHLRAAGGDLRRRCGDQSRISCRLRSLIDIGRASVVMGLFALGVFVILAAGGIDVSFTAIAAFTMYSMTLLVAKHVPRLAHGGHRAGLRCRRSCAWRHQWLAGSQPQGSFADRHDRNPISFPRDTPVFHRDGLDHVAAATDGRIWKTAIATV